MTSSGSWQRSRLGAGGEPEDIELKKGRLYVKGETERGMDLLKAVRTAYYELGTPLYGRGYWAATDIDLVDWKTGRGNLAHGIDFIATAIEMEVDRETGQVRLIRAAHGDDAGQPIHPVMLDGQVNGGSAHMTGHALLEESLYDEKGRMLNFIGDYKQPTALDIPEYIVEHIHTHDPYGPFGAKGAGEASSCSSLAAIANAATMPSASGSKSSHHCREDPCGTQEKGGKVMFVRRLPRLDYHAPTSLPEAVMLLSAHGKDAKLLAGGTDLVLSMKKRTVSLSHLINLKTIPALSGIRADSAALRSDR